MITCTDLTSKEGPHTAELLAGDQCTWMEGVSLFIFCTLCNLVRTQCHVALMRKQIRTELFIALSERDHKGRIFLK